LRALGLPPRGILLALALCFGAVFILLATLAFPKGSTAAVVLLDYGDLTIFPYPFTIQNFMHLVFFLGLGEVFVRSKVSDWERRFLTRSLLPEDEETILEAGDLAPLRRQVAGEFDVENGFLPYLLDLCILQFFASRSVDQVVSVLNSSLELIAHRVDLRYSLLRYLVWVIPTMGFIGTVVGIAAALSLIDPANPDLQVVTANLAVAFNTTIVALAQSAVLVFLLGSTQRKEEEAVNLAGAYCLKNLVNRLYAPVEQRVERVG
jgi:biopolymer transport protein ExbB/TolQ